MRKKEPSIKLHQLPFGDSSSVFFNKISEAENYFSMPIPTLKSFHIPADNKEFAMKISAIKFDRFNLVATSSTSVIQECVATSDYHITIPINGDQSQCHVDGRKFEFSAKDKQALFFAPSEKRIGATGHRSSITIKVSGIDLLRTINFMKGNDTAYDLGGTRVIDIGRKYSSNLFYLNYLMHGLDIIGSDKTTIQMLGIDDQILRYAALICFSDLFTRIDDEMNYFRESSLYGLCDAIKSRIDSPLTLSEMQIISGLSARTLQREFKRRYGLSPLDWQRRERLYLAHMRLVNNLNITTITDLAYDTGFLSSSRFSHYYKLQFGETPSETLYKKK